MKRTIVNAILFFLSVLFLIEVSTCVTLEFFVKDSVAEIQWYQNLCYLTGGIASVTVLVCYMRKK